MWKKKKINKYLELLINTHLISWKFINFLITSGGRLIFFSSMVSTCEENLWFPKVLVLLFCENITFKNAGSLNWLILYCINEKSGMFLNTPSESETCCLVWVCSLEVLDQPISNIWLMHILVCSMSLRISNSISNMQYQTRQDALEPHRSMGHDMRFYPIVLGLLIWWGKMSGEILSSCFNVFGAWEHG